MPVIETERLTKSYGSAWGIEGVTFSVEAGEVFGFLVPTVPVKTTTIRTLLDLLHQTSGSAHIFGLDSRRESVAIRSRLGNLPGDFGYGKGSSGSEALSLLARLRGMEGLGRAEALAKRFRATWLFGLFVMLAVMPQVSTRTRRSKADSGFLQQIWR